MIMFVVLQSSYFLHKVYYDALLFRDMVLAADGRL